jgi:hypothetical protein
LPNSLNLALIIGCLCLTSFLFSLAKNYRILRRFFSPRSNWQSAILSQSLSPPLSLSFILLLFKFPPSTLSLSLSPPFPSSLLLHDNFLLPLCLSLFRPSVFAALSRLSLSLSPPLPMSLNSSSSSSQFPPFLCVFTLKFKCFLPYISVSFSLSCTVSLYLPHFPSIFFSFSLLTFFLFFYLCLILLPLSISIDSILKQEKQCMLTYITYRALLPKHFIQISCAYHKYFGSEMI